MAVMALRRALDGLYRASGALAAVCMVAIAIVVLAQVGANVVDFVAEALTGSPIGLVVPSYANFAGFFLAGATFFALAYTLKHGAHIRVSLVVSRLPPRARRIAEIWCLTVAAALSASLTWSIGQLIRESIRFGDVSTGIVGVPLWIPQSVLFLGLVVLTVALIDELVATLRAGRTPVGERLERQQRSDPLATDPSSPES